LSAGAKYLYLVMKPAHRCASILFLACLFVFLHSCKKEKLPPCKSSCDGITVSGNVMDALSNQPIAGQTLTLDLQNARCGWCTIYVVGSSNSDAQGAVTFKAFVDTATYRDYYFSVTVSPTSSSYISYPAAIKKTIPDQVVAQLPFTIPLLNLYDSLKISLFPKTLLNVNLHRATSFSGKYPAWQLVTRFTNRNFSFLSSDFPKSADTTISYYTSANLYTTLALTSTDAQGVQYAVTDSVKCLAYTSNSINISY
jgi:hypothetical protein